MGISDFLGRKRGALGQLAQGATFGFGDEISSGMAALAQKLINGGDFNEIYKDMLEDERKYQRAYESENPGTALALQLAGGLATSAPTKFLTGLAKVKPGTDPTMINRVLKAGTASRNAAEGALAGAISGVGTSENGNFLKEGLAQGAQGAIAAPAIVGAGKLAGNLLKSGANIIGLQNNKKEAAKLVKAALEADELAVPAARQVADDITTKTGTVPELAMLGGPNMEGLIGTVAKTKGAGSKMMNDLGEGILHSIPSDVTHSLRTAIINPTASNYKLLKDLNTARSTQATPLYQQAFQNTSPVLEPDLFDIVRRARSFPVVKEALRKAELDDVHYPTAWVKDPAQVPDRLATGVTKKINGQEMHEVLTPDLKFWDTVKRSMYEIAKKEGGDTGRKLHELRRDLVTTLDNSGQVDPAYKAARSVFEDASQSKDALELGKNWMKIENADQLRDIVGKFTSQDEKEHFLMGLVGSMVEKQGSTPKGTENLIRTLKSDNKRAILEELLPQGEYEKLIGHLDDYAHQIHKTKFMTLTPHQRLGDISGDQEEIQKAGAALGVTSGLSPSSILNATARALQGHYYANAPALGEEVARLMTGMAPDSLNTIETALKPGRLLSPLAQFFTQPGVQAAVNPARLIGEQSGLERPAYRPDNEFYAQIRALEQ